MTDIRVSIMIYLLVLVGCVKLCFITEGFCIVVIVFIEICCCASHYTATSETVDCQ